MTDRASTGAGSIPVVVLNTHYSGLGVARDLGPLGVRVIGVSAEAHFPGNGSRWLDFRRMPDSMIEPLELLAGLRALAGELRCKAIVFPTRDHDVNFINTYRSQLESCFTVPFAAPDIVARIMDKGLLAQAARRIGIDVPAGLEVNSSAELKEAMRLSFPVVLKPVSASQWRRAGIWDVVGHQKAVKLASYESLQGFYRRIEPHDPKVVVQEWIEGEDIDLQIFGSWCRRDHEVDAFFTARKRIQYPPLLGTGIVVEALPIPELVEPSRQLLRELRFFGISEIEYKRDRRSGRLYLIEINPRHWDQHRLGSAVGVNLSKVAYQDLCNERSEAASQDGRHVYWVAEPELMRHVARVLTGRAKCDGLLPALLHRKSFATFSWSDPAPMWAAIRASALSMFGRTSESVRTSRQSPTGALKQRRSNNN